MLYEEGVWFPAAYIALTFLRGEAARSADVVEQGEGKKNCLSVYVEDTGASCVCLSLFS